MKILVTGLTGLIGSRINELLGKKYEFENLSRENGVDITDSSSVFEKISAFEGKIVIHLAGKTDVDGCEKDKFFDLEYLSREGEGELKTIIKNKTAWALNVLGTQNVVDACQDNDKKIIYISTDFIFDGQSGKPYEEDDLGSPINWYGKTKFEGEKIVKEYENSLIIRSAYPYRASFIKKDFMRVILDRLKAGGKLSMITDHIMTPTFIDDFANALDLLIFKDLKGVIHATGSEFISPYNAGLTIARIFDQDFSLISKTTREEYFKNRAPRPFFLGLKNDKIQRLGIKMKTFQEGLLEIKKQIEEEL